MDPDRPPRSFEVCKNLTACGIVVPTMPHAVFAHRKKAAPAGGHVKWNWSVYTMKIILSDRPLSLDLGNRTDVVCFDLSHMKIAPCVGCFGCWTKTPGKCVIRDDAVQVYPRLAESDTALYVSRVRYGGYDTVMKTMLERAIPVQQAFIRLLDGETHHVQRAVVPKKATIVAYGARDREEEDLFRRLVARNAKNMSFQSYEIRFTNEEQVEAAVRQEVETWV